MTPPLSTKERNRKKRERKKQLQKERRIKEQEIDTKPNEEAKEDDEIEIEYVPESIEYKSDDNVDDKMSDVLQKFQNRGGNIFQTETIVTSDDSSNDSDSDDSSTSSKPKLSNRKLKKVIRPSVAELKRRVKKRPDLVEAHDICAPDPDFLIMLKAVPGSVPVPRHWGRKRKYLQGKRGIEKPPFQLPEFIAKTGITQIRSAVEEDEANKSVRQKNRARVAPKMGGIDVDYRVLHDAFFKYQTIPPLTKFGDLYYEGKEFEVQKLSSSSANISSQPGKISEKLREALGMADAITTPPPWLINMQRYGPPPSYPNLKIPGLNAPIPVGCTYGFHMNGWGKPPVDEVYGRPLYGGDPFGKPTAISYNAQDTDDVTGPLITSHGKHLSTNDWGALPVVAMEEQESSDEEEEEMEESSEEEEQEQEVIPPPPSLPPSILPTTTTAIDLRKTPGDETPAVLYKVLETKTLEKKNDAIFVSQVGYVVGKGGNEEQVQNDTAKVGNTEDDDRVDLLSKKFKF